MLKVSSGPTRGRTPEERWRDRPSSTARRKASSACLCRSLTLASCLFRAARDMTRDCDEYQVSMVILHVVGIRPCGSGGGLVGGGGRSGQGRPAVVWRRVIFFSLQRARKIMGRSACIEVCSTPCITRAFVLFWTIQKSPVVVPSFPSYLYYQDN